MEGVLPNGCTRWYAHARDRRRDDDDHSRRAERDLADRVQRLAEENERSIQGEIRRAIRNHLADQEVRDELEAIPVASAQKIAALRPKRKKESD